LQSVIVLRLFGTPDLRTASDAKAHSVLAQAKHVALLAVAASARSSSVRRDRVIGLLWPELDDDRARNALSKAIHNCRRALGDEVLIGRFAEEIGVDAGKWSVDVWDFEDAIGRGAYGDALAIYRSGEFMEGFHVPDASGLEHWIDAERARLRRRAIEAASSLVANAERDGDATSATAHMRLLSDLSPFDEQVLRRRLTFLDRNADRAGAISAFTEFAERMRRELDALPSPETLALVESIRQRSDAPPGHVSKANGNDVSIARSASSASTEPLSHPPERTVPASTKPRPRLSRGTALLVAGSGLALVATLVATSMSGGPDPKPGSVIVTPFVNVGGDSALMYFGEMVADQLSAALTLNGVADVADSRARARLGLSVASDGFVADQERLAALAREVGATTIITGNYYRAGDSLMVYAALRGPGRNDEPVRFQTEMGPLSDPVRVLSRLEQRLLGAVASLRDARMTASTSTATRTPSFAAYSEYVAGMKAYIAFDHETAAQRFERAYKLDSNFVAIVPVLQEALAVTGHQERADSILAALGERRLLLTPFDQVQLDYTNAWSVRDREAMYKAARIMTTLAPHSPDAQQRLGFAAATTNRFEEAVDAYSRVDFKRGWTYQSSWLALRFHLTSLHLLGRYPQQLELVRAWQREHPSDNVACGFELSAMAPRAPLAEMTRVLNGCFTRAGVVDSASVSLYRQQVSLELLAHGRREDAVQFARPAVEWARRKSHAAPDSMGFKIVLGMSLLQVGAWEEALALWEPLARSRPNNNPPRFAANTAIAAAQLGQTALVEEMLARLTGQDELVQFQRARVLASLNRKEEAMAALRTAVAKGVSPAELVHTNVSFESLRDLPEFQALFSPRK
jgi:serine/threonine-protein kinase